MVARSTDVTNADIKASAWRVKFCVIWLTLLFLKLLLAWHLPLFGDEAFYAWEADNLAWAYSDLPGMTAWLLRLGQAIGGYHVFAIRLPFVLLMAAMPWLVMAIARQLTPIRALHWQTATLACCLPVLFAVGVMALPEAPLCIAFLCCVLAALKCLERISLQACVLLLLGLAIGANTHYRFMVLMAAGLAALIIVKGVPITKSKAFFIGLLITILAWSPVILYNQQHANAGWQFQLVQRNPWQFSWQGWDHLPIQMIVVTPFLYAALLWGMCRVLQQQRQAVHIEMLSVQMQWLTLCCGLLVFTYAVLAFFTDNVRASFHWPLQAYLGLICILPIVLHQYRNPNAEKYLHWLITTSFSGVMVSVAYLWFATVPDLAARLAGHKAYPDNFLAWDTIATAVKQERESNEIVIANHFMLAAQLRFAYQGKLDIKVLDHPLNQKHGRARQLQDWQVDMLAIEQTPMGTPVLLVIEETSTKPWLRDDYRKQLCFQFHQLQWIKTVYGPGRGKYFSIFRANTGVKYGSLCQTDLPIAQLNNSDAYLSQRLAQTNQR